MLGVWYFPGQEILVTIVDNLSMVQMMEDTSWASNSDRSASGLGRTGCEKDRI